ncbi:MAG: hypothetical protein U0169_00060 [Polyangiaceae bacterium]
MAFPSSSVLACATALVVLVSASGCDPDLSVARHDAGTATDSGSTPPVDSGVVTTDAATSVDAESPTDASGADGATDSGSGASPSDAGTRAITSAADFTSGERFATTSTGTNVYTAFVTWDRSRVYFGMQGPDVASGASRNWVVVYFAVAGDGGTGTTTGIAYGSQQPTLPFAATHHVRWKADKSYTNVQRWNGTAWVDGTAFVPLSSGGSGDFLVLSVPRAALGSPDSIKVHVNMLIEDPGNDWTYAGAPSTSFTDGADRDYGKFFEFDLTSSQAPNTFLPKP